MSMIWNAVAVAPEELAGIRAAAEPFVAIDALPNARKGGLDKAWHAAHWLISGGPEAVEGTQGFILSGGRVLEELEAAYGPARYFAAKETTAIRELLGFLGREKLSSRWDPEAIAEDDVYPFSGEVGDADLEYVLDNVDELRAFLNRQELDGLGLLVYLS